MSSGDGTRLEVENLVKTYEIGGRRTVEALRGISFTVRDGEFLTLLGPSGCGKSTALRCIAGLESPTSGRITVDGSTDLVNERIYVPAHKRKMGMVFQSYAVWPHMTVRDNVAYPLTGGRRRRISGRERREVEEKVAEVLRVVGLEGFQPRGVNALSGGQQQRVAVGRAIVRDTNLLLLDEPLSNLDAQLRRQMRVEFRRISRAFGLTTVYVTHDQAEALSMSDRIAVMNAGRIEQLASPEEIYERPASRFVGRFLGNLNTLEGEVVEAGDDLSAVRLTAPGLEGTTLRGVSTTGALAVGSEVVVGLRPHLIEVVQDAAARGGAASDMNVLNGKVIDVQYLGVFRELLVEVGAQAQVRATVPSHTPVALGDTVSVQTPHARTLLLR